MFLVSFLFQFLVDFLGSVSTVLPNKNYWLEIYDKLWMPKEKAGILQGGLIYWCDVEVCPSVSPLQQKGLQPCASHRQDIRRETVITAGPSAISPPHSSLVLLVSVQRGCNKQNCVWLWVVSPLPTKVEKGQRQPVPQSGAAQEETRSNLARCNLDG